MRISKMNEMTNGKWAGFFGSGSLRIYIFCFEYWVILNEWMNQWIRACSMRWGFRGWYNERQKGEMKNTRNRLNVNINRFTKQAHLHTNEFLGGFFFFLFQFSTDCFFGFCTWTLRVVVMMRQISPTFLSRPYVSSFWLICCCELCI